MTKLIIRNGALRKKKWVTALIILFFFVSDINTIDRTKFIHESSIAGVMALVLNTIF